MRDLRFAIRVLTRNGGFTLLAVSAMAFGIAASTLLFSLVNSTLFKSLPYPDSDRLTIVWDQLTSLRLLEFPTSYGIFQDYRERNRSFDKLEAFVPVTATLQFADRAERVGALRVTSGFLPMLGAHTVAGRGFQSGEDKRGADTSVLLSHGLWLRRFGASPTAIGQPLLIDNRSYTIAGVLDAGFRFRLSGGIPPEIVLPVPMDADPRRERGSLRVLGRLKPDVSLAQANADMRSIATRLTEEFRVYRGPRGEDAGYTVAVIPLRDQLFGAAGRSLLLLFAATLVLLTITSVNVAHLFMEWRSKREGEFLIRESLGATKSVILRQLIVESLVVSALGGIGALVITQLALRFLALRLPTELSALDGVSLDARVFLFAAAICMLTGLLFGLLPGKVHRAAGRVTREGLRPWLVAAQTALSVVLLVVAVLLVRSMSKMEAVDPGFRKESILTAQLSIPMARYRDRIQTKAYWDRVIEWGERQPEFDSVALSMQPPMSAAAGGDPFSIEGRPFQNNAANPQYARYQKVSTKYFSLLRIRLLDGRFFQDSDDSLDNSVAIISKTLADGFWPNENPLGKRLVMGAERPGARWLTIVGVVSDVRNSGFENKPIPQIYEPLIQQPVHSVTLLVATRTPPEQLSARLEERFSTFDRETPVYGISTMDQRIARFLEQPRFRTTIFSAFGLIAFLLALFGIYSVTAFRVAQRTREIGIRMAIGATPADIRSWVTRHALRPVAIGLASGIAISLALSPLLKEFLFDVSPADAISYLTAAVLFLGVAWLASTIPAWLASTKQPSITLRHE